MTEWAEFRLPSWSEVKARMAQARVFDGRNIYEADQMVDAGFTYYSVGRGPVRPTE